MHALPPLAQVAVLLLLQTVCSLLALTVVAPRSGCSVTVRPGASGVPRWSVDPCQKTRR